MSEPKESAGRDYRPTVFLPKTDFPMKAGLPEKEPGILARWQADGLYEKLRAARAGQLPAEEGLRDRKVAASLKDRSKPPRPTWSPPSPRPKGRGLIEAPESGVWLERDPASPRPKGRGLIEARG